MVSEEQKDRLFALFVVAVALAFVTIGALGSRTSAKESAEIDGAFDQPEREFRGVWIATAWRLDWPREHYDVEEQRRLLQVIFDRHRATGVNAVFFQVRPSSDAMYASELEPWSKYLTGLQGMPPEPFYDPLAFAIDEANARGMELHAWVNPFRANAMSAVIIDDLHISKRRPEWIVEYALAEYVNPGIPEAREYVVDVIEDIVRRYDVDGVHFDDYFYPYPEGDALFDDTAAFEADPRGFEDIADWRRDNVNLFIQACAARIRDVDSSVRFSVSPYGAWKDDEPPGTRTFPAYDRLYLRRGRMARQPMGGFPRPATLLEGGRGFRPVRTLPRVVDGTRQRSAHLRGTPGVPTGNEGGRLERERNSRSDRRLSRGRMPRVRAVQLARRGEQH